MAEWLSTPHAGGDIVCPSCAAPMGRQIYPKKLVGELVVDICPGCRLIWFDRQESLLLAPEGVLALFKLISTHQGDPVNRIPDALDCPRCSDPLVLTHDMQHSTRFVYFRCTGGHGKLTAFFQFLREKNFVRSLSPAEMLRLQAQVKQVRCSCCGAPVDLATDTVCRYCKSPIAVLDADAMRATLAEVSADAEKHRQIGQGLANAEALMAAHGLSRGVDRPPGPQAAAVNTLPDLLTIGIGLVADVFLSGGSP